MVTILENVLFDSGKADVKLESLGIAKEMSSLLVSASPREITVSGHTDNVPIANAQFASNWELSTQRAVNFMQVLLQNKELQPEKFSAIGYGEYRSIAPNDTQEGKAKNRRVEVFILPLTEKVNKEDGECHPFILHQMILSCHDGFYLFLHLIFEIIII